MTINWIDVNDDKSINVEFNVPNIEYFDWQRLNNCLTDEDIVFVLEDYLTKLDCTIEYSSGRPMMTTYPMYQNHKDMYYYYLLKIKNQYLYNLYLDKLCQKEYNNIVFELEHPYRVKQEKTNTKSKVKKTIPNKFVKAITKDLFTGEEIYVYENLKTGEIIKSKNPDLLDELNAPKKKEKKQRTKVAAVSFEAMTFSFK